MKTGTGISIKIPFRLQGGRRRSMKRCVTQEQLDHLPSDIHKMVARVLVTRGEWIVVEHLVSGESATVVAE